jgi:signal transduction histidine kinase
LVSRSRDAVSIAVRDRGIGIPAHEQREIFQRFVRGAESKARRIKGTGIGLALVQQIVRAHGGSIAVESAVGDGSTFTVVLPMSGGPEPATPATVQVTAS